MAEAELPIISVETKGLLETSMIPLYFSLAALIKILLTVCYTY